MPEQPLKKFVAVTVDPIPRVFVLGEEEMPRKSLDSSPVLHSWMRAGDAGIVGVKFSSWMIKHGKLTASERSTVSRWNESATDFEVFFGTDRSYDRDGDQEDESGHAYMMRMDAATLAVCFPIHGSTLGKKDVEALLASLIGRTWPE